MKPPEKKTELSSVTVEAGNERARKGGGKRAEPAKRADGPGRAKGAKHCVRSKGPGEGRGAWRGTPLDVQGATHTPRNHTRQDGAEPNGPDQGLTDQEGVRVRTAHP